jgi:hypothetical protein
MEIDNAYSPLGILYIHQFQYSGGSDGLNLPTTVSTNYDLNCCPRYKVKICGLQFKVFEIKVLQGIFVAEKQYWKKLYNNYLNDFYCSSHCDQMKDDET